MKKILIATGGTGGHISPALLLAEYLNNDKNYKVNITLDVRGLDFLKKLNQDKNTYKNINITVIRASSFQKYKILFLWRIFLGLLDSLIFIIKSKPDVVVSFGGYPTFPILVIATIFRIPIILHEQNSVMGKVNFIFAKRAKYVALSFPNTLYKGKNIKDIKSIASKIRITGLPTKKLNDTNILQKDKLVIAIFGGSLGAAVLGKLIPQAFSLLDNDIQKKIMVYHQCRQEYISEVEDLWGLTLVDYKIKPFFTNSLEIINKSDFVISRSGAASVFEISSLGKPAIYIPYKYASNNHQYYNALNSYNKVIITEDELNTDLLAIKIKNYLDNIEKNLKVMYPFTLRAEKEIKQLLQGI